MLFQGNPVLGGLSRGRTAMLCRMPVLMLKRCAKWLTEVETDTFCANCCDSHTGNQEEALIMGEFNFPFPWYARYLCKCINAHTPQSASPQALSLPDAPVSCCRVKSGTCRHNSIEGGPSLRVLSTRFKSTANGDLHLHNLFESEQNQQTTMQKSLLATNSKVRTSGIRLRSIRGPPATATHETCCALQRVDRHRLLWVRFLPSPPRLFLGFYRETERKTAPF